MTGVQTCALPISESGSAVEGGTFDVSNPIPAVVRIKANQAFSVDKTTVTRVVGFNLVYPAFPVAASKIKFKIMDERIATVSEDGAVVPTGEAYGYTQLVIFEEGNDEIIRVIPIGVMPKGAIAVPRVVAGYNHGVALKSDGTVWTWGYNGHGELGDGTTANKAIPVQVKGANGEGYLSDIVAISAGNNHSLALKSDGSLWTWGYNYYGQLGDGTTTQRNTPVQVKGVGGSGNLTNIVDVSAGDIHSIAVKSDGSLWSWGYNGNGQLGDGTTANRTTPDQVKGAGGSGYIANMVAAGAGYRYNIALKSDGSLWSFGYNGYGQLGDGTTADRSLPVQVKGANGSGNLTDVVSLAAGYLHSMALKSDGSLWTWGYNAYGQLGDGTVTNRTTPVQVKGGESGEEYLTDMMSVSGGNSHSAGVKKDGSVWGFGYNNYGQIGDGSTINRNAPVRILAGSNEGLKLGYAEITYKGVAQKKYGERG